MNWWRGSLRRCWRTALPAGIGASCVLAFAPFGWWPLPPLALAWLFARQSVCSSPRAAAVLGWQFGLGYFTANVHWIYISLHDYGGMPAPLSALAVLGLAAFLALYPALASWLALRLGGQQKTALLLLALPASWALSEWLRGWVLTGFPWAAIGYSQIPDGPLAGYAPLLGIYGVGLLLAWAGAVLAWLSSRPPRRQAMAGMLGLLLLLGGGLGLRQIAWTAPTGAPLQVALLQGGIPQSQKWGMDELLFNLNTYHRLLQQAQGQLLVMPETAFPLFLHELPTDYLDEVLAMARAKEAALITGVPLVDTDQQRYYNAAVLLSDEQLPAYTKAHLVPFGEYVPLRPLLGWIYRTLLHMPLEDFTAGPPLQPPLRVRDQRIAANICYEDVFGEELLPNARQATILLNLSNLAWFDGSGALAQHGQIAQARALETGRPAMLATNTGTTAVIDPQGRYLARLPERKPAVLTATVQGHDGWTPYLRWGNSAALLLMGGALAAAWQLRRVSRS